MLTSIHIKDVASYDRTTLESLDDLKHINFIYGVNGCGKTTISNFLAGSSPDKYQGCQAVWEHSSPLTTLVYNKEFREENFGDGKIAGVFTLGKATKDEIEEIEEKKKELSDLELSIKKRKETIQKQNDALEEVKNQFIADCWKDVFIPNKDEFKKAFVGSMGSKPDFSHRLVQVCDTEYDANELLSIEDIREKAGTIFGKQPERIEPLTIPSFSSITDKEQDSIWQKVIVGKEDVAIAEIIKSLGISDWVEKGVPHISDSNICPFCQNETITDSFREQIEMYFDTSFKAQKEVVTTTKADYESSFTRQLEIIKALISVEKENSETKLDTDKLKSLLKVLESQFSENKEYIKNKLENVSNVYELTSTASTWSEIKECIEEATAKIVEHNNIVRDFKREEEKLKSDIWLYLADEYQADYEKYKKSKTGIETGIAAISDVVKKSQETADELSDQIRELNKNVTSVQPTVDEINRLLAAFGFHNFSVVPALGIANHYTIEYDDGSLAHKSLSEGEVTFITFLYFLQLVKGAHSEENVSDDRVVVIDDPISSLDSNILFIVSTLIKGIIKDIKNNEGRVKQLIVLTHNVYFHKEASFIDGRTTKNNQTNFWIIKKINKVSKIQSFGMENPIESSYELLWNEVKNWSCNSGITVQNTMRRIIENYFKILGKFGDDDLINKFKTQEERDICRSLLCWINDGSHCLPDDLFIQTSESETERYIEVFKSIFEHTDNIGHYNMMMK